jgi:hypothetical protein
MSFGLHVLEFLAITGLVVIAGLVATYLVARRLVRRRWRAVQSHVVTRGALTTVSFVAAWRERVQGGRTVEELSRGTATRVRRRMWLAIDDADAAVRHADASEAPVAELPAVCRSLRSVATELDTLLRLERRLPVGVGRPDAVRVQVADVIHAAREVQTAALRACSDATEPQIRALVREARDEVEIVAAALARLRSVTPHPR